jgi:hypothetical protein
MNIKVDDIVNIQSSEPNTFWKGKVYEIDSTIIPEKALASVKALSGKGHALVYQKNLEFKEGEWWETTL